MKVYTLYHYVKPIDITGHHAARKNTKLHDQAENQAVLRKEIFFSILFTFSKYKSLSLTQNPKNKGFTFEIFVV